MWKLWPVGRVFGTELKLHGTWVLMLLFYALTAYVSGGVVSAVVSLALALTLFATVVLHELGHIAAYRYYGMQAKDIILTPLGGVARGLGMTQVPRQELVIAAAGPAVNAVLALLAFGALQGIPWQLFQAPLAYNFTWWFLEMNLTLGLFNLLPALPMDGGRILRAFLAMRMGYLQATQKAVGVARWTTLAMGLGAIALGSFTLFFIAIAVYLMSRLELAQTRFGQPQDVQGVFRILSNLGAGRQSTRQPAASSVVDQWGRPVGATEGWSVKSVRWSDGP